MSQPNAIGWKTATAIVIANMIGTGVFTSLGFQLVETTNTWSILLLWGLGAIMAICGAFSYAELGTHLVRSGGEYNFLSKTYHPLVGYLSGWVSLTVGFAAPVALAAMALGEYVGRYIGISSLSLACFIILGISVVHSISLNTSSRIQNTTTLIKVILILIFIFGGFLIIPEESGFDWGNNWQNEITTPAFAVSFVYVTFSYTGWNAAAYIIDEIRDVQRNLPIALLTGTLVVSTIYIFLNLVFLRQSSVQDLAGQLEVGQVVAISMFGERGGALISGSIGLMLISSISAMVWAGPRVIQVIAEDHQLWKVFATKNTEAIPIKAVWLQTTITLLLVFTGTFEQVLIYSGFILQFVSALAVGAIFILRKEKKGKNGFKSPLYPIPQVIFITLSIWVLGYLLFAQPFETSLGILNLVIGSLTYWWSQSLNKN